MDLSSDQLTNKITVSNAENSQVVNISVQDPDPAIVVVIANTTAAVFQEEIQELMKVDNVSILSFAVGKENQVSVAPNPMLNMAIAAVVGLMLGVDIMFLLEYLDTSMKNEQDIEGVHDMPLLGVISPINEDAKPLSIKNKSRRKAG